MNPETPKTLREAQARELSEGPLSTVHDRLHAATQDFMAQHFGIAMMKYPDCAPVLQTLFKRLIAEAEEVRPYEKTI